MPPVAETPGTASTFARTSGSMRERSSESLASDE